MWLITHKCRVHTHTSALRQRPPTLFRLALVFPLCVAICTALPCATWPLAAIPSTAAVTATCLPTRLRPGSPCLIHPHKAPWRCRTAPACSAQRPNLLQKVLLLGGEVLGDEEPVWGDVTSNRKQLKTVL